MRFLKPTVSFFLFVLILSVSAGSVQAKHKKGKYKGKDLNHSGVITREEWRGNDVSFNNHDWNGDGVLSGDEVKPGSNRPQVEQHANVDQYGALDYNDDGVISRSEWRYTGRSFEQLDFNHDGQLNRDEFYNRTRYSVSVFQELDQNNDGWISRNEWRSDITTFSSLDTNRDNLLNENEFNDRQSTSLAAQFFQDIFRRQ